MTRTFLITAIATFSIGCSYGMTADKFRPATDVRGVEARIRAPRGELRGELVEVRDSGLVIITADRVVRLVPYASVQRATFEQLGSGYEIKNATAPSGTRLERLRLVSRYPAGLTETVLAALLKAHGQTALAGVVDEPKPAVSPEEFVKRARLATEKYRDRSAAIVDGYRRIGRDFPAMGEHWIRMSLVFDGQFDAARPEVLNYIDVGGSPRLVGLGYAVPLLPGEKAPAGPASSHAWHDHSRTIEDETVLPHHHTHGAAGDGPRLAMMHAWIWSPNPDGVFAADNWALPYLRLGLTASADASLPAAKALSLASGGRDYFEMSIETAGLGAANEKKVVKQAFDTAETAVAAVVRNAREHSLREPDVTRLASIWDEIWTVIDGALNSEARQKLAGLPIR